MARHIAYSARGRGIKSAALQPRQSSTNVEASPPNNAVSQEEPSSAPNVHLNLSTENAPDDQPTVVASQPGLSSVHNPHPTPLAPITAPLAPTTDSGTRSQPSTPMVPEDNEERAPLQTNPSDTRELIEVVTKKLDGPGRAALVHIIHSHFDGPYTFWGEVADGTHKQWWTMFKKQCRWDKGRFSEEQVYKAFNHEGSRHLGRILQTARDKKRRPVWIKEKIWDEMWVKWKSREFQHKSEVNKRNRAIAKEKGIPPYRGGSITTTAHKNKMKDKDGQEPSPKKLFERCYKRKKDGALSEKCQQIMENYDTLLEEATQEAPDSEVPPLIDKNEIWLKATGGSRKGRVIGMGSESESMLKRTRNVHGATSVGACGSSEVSESMREDMMAQLSSLQTQITQEMASLNEKMTIVQENQEETRKDVTNLADTMQRNQDQVREDITNIETYVDNSVGAIRSETSLNNDLRDQSLQETIINSVKEFFAKQSS